MARSWTHLPHSSHAAGYASASTKEIAHAARTSETAVHKHFESKAELFTAAALVPFTEFIEDYAEAFRSQMVSDKDDYELIDTACDLLLYGLLPDKPRQYKESSNLTATTPCKSGELIGPGRTAVHTAADVSNSALRLNDRSLATVESLSGPHRDTHGLAASREP